MVNAIAGGIVSGANTRAEFGESDESDNYFENNIERVISRTVNYRIDHLTYSGSGVFILGNSTFGILGSQWLGLAVGTEVRTREHELKIWTDYSEDFSATTYRNAGSTTATGWGTGSLTFIQTSATYDMTSGSATASIAVSTGSVELA